jgi:hypothetical protein
MTLEKMREYVAAVPWRFAKTMPENPHEYTLKKVSPGREKEFEAVVIFIRQQGYKKKFGRATYIYVDLDGWCYWTMGAPLEQTILINRARLEGQCSTPQGQPAIVSRSKPATSRGRARSQTSISATPRKTLACDRHLLECAACGRRFSSRRSDARTCSTKCRVRNHRSLKAAL